MSEASQTSPLRCIVVTPEETVLDSSADFIALPLFDGELGVARGHSPLIGRLGYGELRIRAGEETVCYYVDGGFVQVVDNVVSVLTNRSIRDSAVDTVAASEQLAEALSQKVGGEEALAIRDRLVSQSRAQLRVGLNRK